MHPPTSLISLPTELVEIIVSFLTSQRDISRFARTHRQHYICIMQCLLKHNIKYENSSALQWAAKHNHLPFARCLIKFGADPNANSRTANLKPTRLHWPPLHYSAKNGHIEMLRLLLRAGADPNLQCRDILALAIAIMMKREPIVRILTPLVNSLDMPAARTTTALELARSSGLTCIVQVLLQAGASVNAQTGGASPLVRLLECSGRPRESTVRQRVDELDMNMLRLFLEYGDAPDAEARRCGLNHLDPRVRYAFYGRVDTTVFAGNQDRAVTELGNVAVPMWLERSRRARERCMPKMAPDVSGEDAFPALCEENRKRASSLDHGAWVPSKTRMMFDSLPGGDEMMEKDCAKPPVSTLFEDLFPCLPGEGKEIEAPPSIWKNFKGLSLEETESCPVENDTSACLSLTMEEVPEQNLFPALTAHAANTGLQSAQMWSGFRSQKVEQVVSGGQIAATSNEGVKGRGSSKRSKQKWSKIQL